MAQVNEGNEPGLETPRPTVNRRWQNSPDWRSKTSTSEQQTDRGSGSRWEKDFRPSQPGFTRNTPNHRNSNRTDRDHATNSVRPFNKNSNKSVDNDSLSVPEIPASFAEGRRLYVGNMPYMAKKEDVEALFNSAVKHGEGYYQMYRTPAAHRPLLYHPPLCETC